MPQLDHPSHTLLALTLTAASAVGLWTARPLAAQTAADLLPEPVEGSGAEMGDGCQSPGTSDSLHSSVGGSVRVSQQSCDGAHTLTLHDAGDPTAPALLRLQWVDGEDGWVPVGELSDSEPTPLVLVRTSSLLADCEPVPPLDPHTWAGAERGLVRVSTRFRPGTTPLTVDDAGVPDHFADDARLSFVSSDASIGFARSWGPPSDVGWTPLASTSPAFAVFAASEGVPLAGFTAALNTDAPVEVALQVGTTRYAATLGPGVNTLLLPSAAAERCAVLTVAPSTGLQFTTLRPITTLDTRPLERALRVVLLPELASRDEWSSTLVSRVIASAGPDAVPVLVEELELAAEPLQSRLVDTLARMDGGAAALLEAGRRLELSDDARARIARVLADDADLAADSLSDLADFPATLQVAILRAAADDENAADEVATVLRGWLSDETRRDDATLLAPDLGLPVIQSLLARYDLSDDAAETAPVRIAMLRLLSRADNRDADGLDLLATDAMAARNGTEARLGIALCSQIAADATCWTPLRELTDDPEPQLRADAWSALLNRTMSWSDLTRALDDASPTVRLAAARATLRGATNLDASGWDVWLAQVERETWPQILRLHGTVLAGVPAGSADRVLALAIRAGGADGASIARQLGSAGMSVPCDALLQSLGQVEPDAGAAGVSLAASLMDLASVCEGAAGPVEELRRWEESALADGRLTEAYLSAMVGLAPDAADQALEQAFAGEPAVHAAAVRALRWFSEDVRRRSIERWSSSAPDDRSAWEWNQVRQELGLAP